MKNKLFQPMLIVAVSVAISYTIIKPMAQYEANKTIEYVMRCEQLLMRGKLEPICAGYLAYIGYDVETQATIYSSTPYDPKQAKEKVLAQTREIGVKP